MWQSNVQINNQRIAFLRQFLGFRRLKVQCFQKSLSATIFGINKNVSIAVYDNGKTRFEVFINTTRREPTYDHICIEVDNKSDFITQCKQQGLDPFFVEKEGKQLLFVRDFSNNLYEVK